jgi:hypothetical protein
MNNSTVILKNASNVVIDQVTTNASGNYSFKVLDGSYNLSGTTTKPWGGVNSSDALAAMKHFVGITPLTGLNIVSANVNADLTVNSTDALLIQRRFVGLVSSFPAGNWAFETASQTISGTDVVRDLKALCYGDANGSFVPAAKEEASVRLIEKNTINPLNGEFISLPFGVESAVSLGAISLVLELPAGAIVQNVEMTDQSNVVFNQNENLLFISWFGIMPLQVNAGETVFSVSLSGINMNNNTPIGMMAGSQISDWNGTTYSNMSLTLPKVVFMEMNTDIVRNYPNPASGQTVFTVQVQNDGPVSVRIFNICGELVSVPYSGFLTKGSHAINYDVKGLKAGSYMLVFESQNGRKSSTKLIVID